MATSEVTVVVRHLGKTYVRSCKTNFDEGSSSILQELEYQASYCLRDAFRDVAYDTRKPEVTNPFAWSRG